MTEFKNRLATLDVLRGFAMLGILIMNVQSFSMPSAAYMNPMAYGDLSGVNWWVWVVGHVFADLKFMTLFSMLFGAGIILFLDKAEQKNKNAKKLHFKRMFGLLIFGLIHSYLFWYGDILFYYSICGFIAYFFRNKSIKTLMLLALGVMSITSLYSIGFGLSMKYVPKDVLLDISQNWKPSAENLEKEIAAYLGGFLPALKHRAGTTIFMQTYLFLSIFIWRITGAMFIGMALYKSRFFHSEWKKENYKKMAFASFSVGLAITLLGVYQFVKNKFSFEYGMFIGNQFNFWGSLFLSLSYASGIVLFVQSSMGQNLKNRFSAIGRTAFSNYFMQTLICTTLFYGYGFGFYGQFERWHQATLVLLVWIFQLWLAPVWIGKFRYGPMEWLWRSFTYGKFQSMKN